MKADKGKSVKDCEVLIAKSCGTFIAIPKMYLCAVKDFEETAKLDNLQKPLIGVAQNAGKAVLLADPKFIIGSKRQKSHIPKFLLFLENKDRNISLQVDEIIGLRKIPLQSNPQKKLSKNPITFQMGKFRSQKLALINVEGLLNSLIGKNNNIYKDISVDFVKTTESNDELRSFLSFVFDDEKFAIEIENLNGVKPIEEIKVLDPTHDDSVPIVGFDDTICPFVSERSSLYAIQAFFSPATQNSDGRHAIAIGSSSKCELHNISTSKLVRTNKNNGKQVHDLTQFKSIFEASSSYGFDIGPNEHIRVVNLESVAPLKSLYPISPKLKQSSRGVLQENANFLSVSGNNFNYIFPLSMLKKVSLKSEIKISKNQNINMLGFTELEGKVTAVFNLDVVLGGQNDESKYVIFIETDGIQAALAVPKMDRVSIPKNLLSKDIRENNSAMFQDVAAAKVVYKSIVYYQLEPVDLQERLLRLSK